MRSWDGRDGGVGRCVECGERLGSKGTYFILQHPDGVHARCRRWETEPFPFDGDLERLRHAARALRVAVKEVQRDGRWLVSAKATWPERARERAATWRERKARLIYRLVRLRDRLDV